MNFVSILKKNLTAFVAATLGLFHFILLAIPFCGAFTKVNGVTSNLGNLSGYQSMGEEMTYSNGGGFATAMQILNLLVAISLLLVGSYLVVKAILGDKVSFLPAGFGSFTFEFLCRILLLAYAGMSLMVLLAAIIVAASNTTSATIFYQTIKAGVSLGAGPILGVLLSAGGVVTPWLLKKLGVFKDAAPTPEATPVAPAAPAYEAPAAPACEAPAAPVCEAPAAPVCEAPTAPATPKFCCNCGTPLESGAAFCCNCGSKIAPPVYVCSQCGAPSSEGNAFCSQCGGKIVQK